MTPTVSLTERGLARAAAVIAGFAFVIGMGALLLGRFDPGIRFFASDGKLYVEGVERFSQAERDGLRPGMVVQWLNDVVLIRLPEPIYGEFDEETGEQPVIDVEPATPTPVGMSDAELQSLASNDVHSLAAIDPISLEHGSMDVGWNFVNVWYPQHWLLEQSSLALLPGLGLLLVGTWWVASGRAGESLRGLAVPLGVAAAVPFFVQPVFATDNPLWTAIAGTVCALAVVPLGLALAERVPDSAERRFVSIGVWILAAAAAVASVLYATRGLDSGTPATIRWVLVGAVALAPGLAAAGPLNLDRWRAAGRTPGTMLQSTELAVAGATPLFAMGTDTYPYLIPLALWLGAVAVAGRWTVRPLARLVTRAQLQRDLVVAATEAERARLAADIHDDALQELTLLVRRLEAAGDEEGAEIGRTVAERLRAICGDLRLPILDDLGVGPALDWLVLRIERLAGGEVRLERTDGARHVPDVELAVFRVAQEALANAVKHGSPPIVVRYQSTPSGISLSIDDSGPGITPDAGETAEREGHFGLLNMQQRAEQIGAILDVRRWPSGGTHVALEWRQG